MLAPVFPAIVKPAPNPTDVAPAPIVNQKLREELVGVCAGAATSGSFVIGAACGIVVVIGVLAARAKLK